MSFGSSVMLYEKTMIKMIKAFTGSLTLKKAF
jgi:hypothetical protein